MTTQRILNLLTAVNLQTEHRLRDRLPRAARGQPDDPLPPLPENGVSCPYDNLDDNLSDSKTFCPAVC